MTQEDINEKYDAKLEQLSDRFTALAGEDVWVVSIDVYGDDDMYPDITFDYHNSTYVLFRWDGTDESFMEYLQDIQDGEMERFL